MKPSEMTKEQLDGRITRTAWNFAAKIIEVHTEEEFNLQDEGVIDAINAAWALAKAANFTFSEE